MNTEPKPADKTNGPGGIYWESIAISDYEMLYGGGMASAAIEPSLVEIAFDGIPVGYSHEASNPFRDALFQASREWLDKQLGIKPTTGPRRHALPLRFYETAAEQAWEIDTKNWDEYVLAYIKRQQQEK
jgi:hypothetical protein